MFNKEKTWWKLGQASRREQHLPNIQHLSTQIQPDTDHKQPYMCKWVWSMKPRTYIQYLKREPSWSLRHSVKNKYLIGGWPTSCALKSYLSYSASIHCLLPQALQWRLKKRETLMYKERGGKRERGNAKRRTSWRGEWEVIWTENKWFRDSFVELHLKAPELLAK